MAVDTVINRVETRTIDMRLRTSECSNSKLD